MRAGFNRAGNPYALRLKHLETREYAEQLVKFQKECNTPVINYTVNDFVIDEEFITSISLQVHTVCDAEINA